MRRSAPLLPASAGNRFPVTKRPALQSPDIGNSLRPFPIASIMSATGPPSLSGQTIGFANDEHGEFRLACRTSAPIHFVERPAKRPHLRTREPQPDGVEQRRVADRFALRRVHPEQCFYPIHIVEDGGVLVERGRIETRHGYAVFRRFIRSMIASACAMMSSINCFTVGMSLMSPATMPHDQAPLSISPFIMIEG